MYTNFFSRIKATGLWIEPVYYSYSWELSLLCTVLAVDWTRCFQYEVDWNCSFVLVFCLAFFPGDWDFFLKINPFFFYSCTNGNSENFTCDFITLTLYFLWSRNTYHLKMYLLCKIFLYNKHNIFICSYKFLDAYASTFVRYFASLGKNIVVGCSQAAYGGKLFIFSTSDTSVTLWNLFVERCHCSQSIMCRAYSYNSNLHCFIWQKN